MGVCVAESEKEMCGNTLTLFISVGFLKPVPFWIWLLKCTDSLSSVTDLL